MTFRTVRCLAAAVGIVALAAGPAAAQHEGHQAGLSADQVGTVSFETSCQPALAADINRGVALLHSFWFPEAVSTFEDILKKDPGCAIAHWGIALSHWGNPFGGLKPARAVEAGRAAIDKAQATGSPTPRERGYIDAAARLFADADPGTQRARTMAYADAMGAVSKAHPADREARIFYALAVNQTASPTDKTYARQLEAAAILEPMFRDMPDHPGLAHYIIHAYDHPPLAPKALDAARRYASIAPAVPHALHMPSHTFTRVGSWQESIDTNRKSAEAARQAGSPGEELHALDYQTYAYLQIAQDKAAKGVLDHALAIVGGTNSAAAGATGAGGFATAAIPARYALERGAWAEAAALPLRPISPPYAEAITHFARALGAARSGKPAEAAADLERLAALRDQLMQMKDAYWAEQVDIQRRVAAAWVAFASGQREAGIAQLTEAAAAEGATDKAAITPGPIASAQEQLGDMLLEAGRAADALAAYETAMEREPNRFRGLYGAARAAEAAGQREKAAEYSGRLLEVAATADTDRPELRQAKSLTGR